MFSNPKKFTSAATTLLASQVAAFQASGNNATTGVEKAVALNLAATKASVENSVEVARQLATAKDPQEFFSLTAAQAQPVAETMASYCRDMTEIATGMWAEFMDVAETQFAITQSQVTTLAGDSTNSVQASSGQQGAALASATDRTNADTGK